MRVSGSDRNDGVVVLTAGVEVIVVAEHDVTRHHLGLVQWPLHPR